MTCAAGNRRSGELFPADGGDGESGHVPEVGTRARFLEGLPETADSTLRTGKRRQLMFEQLIHPTSLAAALDRLASSCAIRYRRPVFLLEGRADTARTVAGVEAEAPRDRRGARG